VTGGDRGEGNVTGWTDVACRPEVETSECNDVDCCNGCGLFAAVAGSDDG